ncbi:hypothetical protein FSZ31_09795 [Sphingorhabdus soli]|uniref:ATPase n=1 Tax=Flavisphingopyxis soli TaxID=2601267 RepID=A0A5C6U9P8_9SPHN|nr:hypothetical protein [Sphingorhabdus soli]TXC69200.1 hypothetical protein FSZ31_09795 [Sphingorhabdus soli]
MAGESKIIGIWPRSNQTGSDMDDPATIDEAPAPLGDNGDALATMTASDEGFATAPAEPDSQPWTDSAWDDADSPETGAGTPWAAILIGVAAAGWTGFYAWLLVRGDIALTDAAAWASALATASIPLILLAALYLIFQRSSAAETNRYGRLIRDLDSQTGALNSKLEAVNASLALAHRQMRDDGERLSALGIDVGGRIVEASERIRGEMTATLGASDTMAQRAKSAFDQVEGLLAGLPRVDAVAARLTENLRQAGLAAHQHGSALQAQIATLEETAAQSEQGLSASTVALAAQIEELGEQSDGLTKRLDATQGELLATIGASLTNIEQALTSARDSARAEIEAMVREAESARDRLVAAGDGLAETTRERLAECDDVVAAIGDRLNEQTDQADSIVEGFAQGIEQSREAMATLDSDWTATLGGLGAAIETLSGKTETMAARLSDSETIAQRLLSRSEDLMLALDSVAREIDETLPRALARLDGTIGQSRTLMNDIAPAVETMEAVGNAALERLKEAQALLANQSEETERQRDILGELATANGNALRDMKTLIADIESGSQSVADSAAPQLVEAMVRVKETAGQAIAHARTALASVVADAADTMREATMKGLSETLEAGVADRMREITQGSQRAVEAARAATELLMQQMTTISDASSAIEARVADARAAVSDADHESLSRHVTLLTESLKSTAIDVTKILSNEVTDTAWAAYLKGDRGVFTRRAVRLLDATDAREILAYYENDADFREYVNRYIHDFEAMLRTLLGTRDGQALSVTLLSSDMGKLYVALAQAIERLRD